MGTTASQITILTIVYSTVYSGADQSSASQTFVRGLHRRPVNSPHKWPVTRKMFLFNYVIMILLHYLLHKPFSSCWEACKMNFVLNSCDRYVKCSYIIASTHANPMLDFSPIHHAYPLPHWIPSCYAAFPLICAKHELAWCFHEVNLCCHGYQLCTSELSYIFININHVGRIKYANLVISSETHDSILVKTLEFARCW